MEQNLYHSSIGTIVFDLLLSSYPLKLQDLKIAKIVYLEREELFAQKSREKLSEYELVGDNYLFWAFATLNKPATKSRSHRFEERKSKSRFIFGQLICCNGLLVCDAKETDYFYWAKVAYVKNWFCAEDVRDVQISYFQDEFGKLTSKLQLERDAGSK